jgi:hypothetical protein
MQVGISDEERDALIAFLRERIEKERLPRTSRLPLKRFLSKIEPAPNSARCLPSSQMIRSTAVGQT